MSTKRMIDPVQTAPARYALRRTMPKWCFDERLSELLQFCRQATIEEVVIKVDTEELSHGIPTVKWLAEYVPLLERARDRLRNAGIEFSINPWVTLDHCDRGRDLRKVLPDIDWMQGYDGTQCHACACPLSPGWREHATKLWRMYASTHPHVMWIEDDMRAYKHRPVTGACFCDLHMKEFSRRVGKRVSRQQLMSALLKPGRPHPWRAIWLDIQRDSIIGTCQTLVSAARDISPQTRIGLMSSGPANQCIEGRDWQGLAETLKSSVRFYSRPPMATYSEASLQELYLSSDLIRQTRFALGPAIEQTEVENVPFSGYSKSATYTFLQIAASMAHGCHGVTMNLFDHLGTPIEDCDPAMGPMLATARPFIDALANSHDSAGVFQGVRLLWHPSASYVKRLAPGAQYPALASTGHYWGRVLNCFGITTTYGDSPVVAADGQTIRAFSDDEILQMLRGGLLLDLTALSVLNDRGFGRLVGASVKEVRALNIGHVTAAEEFTDRRFAGAPRRLSTMSTPTLAGGGMYGVLRRSKAARVISRLVDQEIKPVCDLTTIFTNRLGGRVAIVPLDLETAFGPAFLNNLRREHTKSILHWLARGHLPATISGGVYPLAYRMDLSDHIMLGLFNLSHDDWPSATWDLHLGHRRVSSVKVLESTGRWRDLKMSPRARAGRVTIQLDRPVSFRLPAVLKLE